MQDIINAYHSIPSETWVALLGAGGVSFFTQIGKKLLKLESENVVQMLFAVVAQAATTLQYLTSQHNLPPSVLGIHTAALMGLATPLYFYVIKPADGFLSDLSAYKAAKAKVTAEEASTLSSVDQAAAAIAADPVTASPATTTPPEFQG